MEEKKSEIVGYYTEDENIYCTECLFKNIEIMKRVEQAIASDGPVEGLYFCDGCGKEIRRQRR